jgi:hypothetical protein
MFRRVSNFDLYRAIDISYIAHLKFKLALLRFEQKSVVNDGTSSERDAGVQEDPKRYSQAD